MHPKLLKLDLPTDAEYVADVVNVNMKTCNSAVYYMGMLYLHNDILPPPKRLCFHRCLFVCLLAALRKNFRTDLHEIFREGWQWAIEQITKFRWRSPTDSPNGGTDIATLVRRAFAEVCTVKVPLVFTDNIGYNRLKCS